MIIRKLVLAALLAMLAFPATAQMKIGVVDLRQAVFTSKAAEDFGQLLQGELRSEETQLRQAQEEAQKLQDRLEKDGAMMNDAERERLANEFEQKVRQFHQMKGQFDQMVNQRQQQFLQQARPLVDSAMEQLLDNHELDLILPREAVVYVTPDHDLTEELIKLLNAQVE